MADVTIKETIQTVTVIWPTGNLFNRKKEVYPFDVGDPLVLAELPKKAEKLEKLAKDIENKNNLADVQSLAMEVLGMVYDTRTVNHMVKRAHGNIFALMQIVNVVSNTAEAGMNEIKAGL